jgi:4-coumarate--CoA ligase
MECMLLDDDGKEVGLGEPGEIYIRGPNVCLGYWKNEAATLECLDSDGWLKTGDVAVADKQERFWIVDRKKVCAIKLASRPWSNTAYRS